MAWEIVIGLEVHVQLSTVSKIFSGASTAFGAAPNTQACAVDLAFPGVLPVLNRATVDKAIALGLALNATINRKNVFARKNYFYPDLPKGYQISQMDSPIVEQGTLTIQVKDEEKTIRVLRAHLEEDAGKSLHEDSHGLTGIDLNRAGIPLLEVVSEPDMRCAEEAVAYAKTLHTLVTWLDICDGNMQEGSFRIDANVSVRPLGQLTLGTRCEIKNLNSFRFLEAAIQYEAKRQIEVLTTGGHIVQETRLYDADRDETRAMRSKEDAHDYRYFPDPDLLPVQIDNQQIATIRAGLPELPAAIRARFIERYRTSSYDVNLLTASREVAYYFDSVVNLVGADHAKIVANWINGEVAAALHRTGKTMANCPIGAPRLAGLIHRLIDHTISHKIAKEVFETMWQSKDSADAIIDARGFRQITDTAAIETMVKQVMVDNAKSVEEFRAGKDKALNALVGQIMKLSRGTADPAQVQQILKRMIHVSSTL